MATVKKRYTIETVKPTPFYEWIAEDKEVIVLNIDGKTVVFDSICPHFGGRLELDLGDNNKLACPFHGIKFDIRSCLGTNRVYKKIKKYNVVSQNPLIIED